MSSAEPHGLRKSDVNFQTCYSTERGDPRTEPVKSPRKWVAKMYVFGSQALPCISAFGCCYPLQYVVTISLC